MRAYFIWTIIIVFAQFTLAGIAVADSRALGAYIEFGAVACENALTQAALSLSSLEAEVLGQGYRPDQEYRDYTDEQKIDFLMAKKKANSVLAEYNKLLPIKPSISEAEAQIKYGLRHDEWTAITSYTDRSATDSKMNGMLRKFKGEPVSEDDRAKYSDEIYLNQTLKAALVKLPIFRRSVFRGFHLDPGSEELKNFMTVGAEVPVHYFMSLSKSEFRAEQYMGPYIPLKKGLIPIVLELRAETVDISEFNFIRDDFEVLAVPDLVIHIESVEVVRNINLEPYYRVVARQVLGHNRSQR